MNCVNCYVEPQKLHGLAVTILDVFDDYALSNAVREEMYKCYPSAKLAHLKSGGNFPYLSRSDEVNLHLQVSVLNTVKLEVFQ
jgi:maspardin